MDGDSQKPASPAPPLGGWLLLLAIQMISVPAFLIYNSSKEFAQLQDEEPALLGTAWFNLSLSLRFFMLAIDIFAAVFFFQRRRIARILLPAYFWISGISVLGLQMLDHVYLEADYDLKSLRSVFFFVILWTAYFQLSKRVKATFVR